MPPELLTFVGTGGYLESASEGAHARYNLWAAQNPQAKVVQILTAGCTDPSGDVEFVITVAIEREPNHA
jgi:hypothetical protein